MAIKKRHPQGLQSPGASTATTNQNKLYQAECDPINRVKAALESAGSRIRPSGEGFTANCPAHRDQRPSLTFSEGDDGRVLLHCHRGCSVDAVLAKLGLEMVDLYRNNPDSKKRVEARYSYLDESGEVLFQVTRLKPKGFYMRRPDGEGRWITNATGVRRVLYRLPEVIKAVESGQRIWIAEGEKDVEALRALGEVATCNPGGAGKWSFRYRVFLQGADVSIVGDNDQKGRAHAREMARDLTSVAKSVELLRPAKGCNDISEHLDAGHSLDELVELRPSLLKTPTTDPGARKRTRVGAQTKPKASARLVHLVNDAGDIFRSGDQAYAAIQKDGHRETWPIRSREFKGWLAQELWRRFSNAVANAAIEDALRIIEAESHSKGERPVFIRVAEGSDRAVYVDLADEAWRAVKITGDDWQIVDEPPVHFLRKGGMLPLPTPEPGGNLMELHRFINATHEEFVLLMAWLVGAFCPWGPYSILQLRGEQGSAKTTTAEVLQRLIDPNKGRLRTTPRSELDLAISARNGWLLAYDNVSWMPPWLSDALCRLSTGGGLALRRLYTTDEEEIFSACRPIVMNGIEELGTRPDLLDRTLLVTLETITEDRRQDARAFWSGFHAALPRLMGGILDAVSLAIRERDHASVPHLSRMADFAKWGAAASPAFGGKKLFLKALDENTARVQALVLESNPIVSEILQLLEDEDDGSWKGNAETLLRVLDARTGRLGSSFVPPGWPKSARQMGGMLHRIAPALRAEGIEADYRSHGRQWRLKLPPKPKKPRNKRPPNRAD